MDAAATIEIRMLAWAVVLGLVQLVLAVSLVTRERGVKWNVGARDAALASVSPVTGRVDRAFRNFLETFPLFAAAVLAVVATDRTGSATGLGVQAAGVPYLRTLVWTASVVGLVMVLSALF